MIGYLDSSVLLRVLLNQAGRLREFSRLTRPVSSKLLKTECLRALDRARLNRLLTEDEHLTALKELHEALESVEWIEVSSKVLDRAGGGFPVSLGTLDAIHLSSAILWREQAGADCAFLTHDSALQKAALAAGFTVLG
jgi:predicted nucleic acid-binding protein